MADLFPTDEPKGEKLSYSPYTNKDFTKTAQEIELSQDVRDWPAAIITEFASQHPYAFQQSAPEIEFEKIDEKTGSAFGAVILRKPYQVPASAGPRERLETEPEKVAVPVIVEEWHLKPFEIFIRGDKVIPLTENRFAEMNAGSPVANGIDPYFQPSPLFLDKMIPPTVGYLGNLYGNYSLSGGEGDYSNFTPNKGAAEKFDPKLEKRSSADSSKERSFLTAIKNTIRHADYEQFGRDVQDDRAMAGFQMNRTSNIVKEILGTKPTSFDDYLDFVQKAAPVHVVCLRRLSNGKWRATEANDYYYKPVTRELSAAEAISRYGALEPKLSRLMQEHHEVLIESSDRKPVRPIVLEEHEAVAEEVEADGHYLCVTKTGGFVEGQVFTKLLDYNGNLFPYKLFIGGGSAYALQENMVGERLGDVWEGLKNGSFEVGAEGTFVGEQDGAQCVLTPFRVTNVGWVNGYLVAQAMGRTGELLAFVMMPGVTRFSNATGVADSVIGGNVAANVFFVPPSWHFVAFTKKLRLIDDPREVKARMGRRLLFPSSGQELAVETSAKGNSRSLRVISDRGHITLRGDILETVGYDDMAAQSLEMLEAHWVLTILGVPLNECGRITAMAVSKGEVNVSNLRPAKDIVKRDQIMDRQVQELAALFRRNLFKEASTIGDPKAVDAMLSLNFVNESNLLQFMQNLPMFRDVEEKLAELYLYTALGLKSQIPEQPVLSAMKALNEVNEHLEYLQSMLRMPESQAQPQPVA